MVYSSLEEIRAAALWECGAKKKVYAMKRESLKQKREKYEEAEKGNDKTLNQEDSDHQFNALVDILESKGIVVGIKMRIVELWPQFQLWHYVNSEVMNDHEFVSRLVVKDPHLYEFLSEDMQKNLTVVRAMLQQKPLMYHYIPEALKIRTDLIEIVLNQKPWLFVSLPDQVKKNKIFIKMALKGLVKIRDIIKTGDAYLRVYREIVPEKFLDDSDCIKLGLTSISILNDGVQKKTFNQIVPENKKNDDRFIIDVIFKQCKMYEVSKWMTKKQKNDCHFMARLLEQYGWGIESAGKDVLMNMACLSTAFSNWTEGFLYNFTYSKDIVWNKESGSESRYKRRQGWLKRTMIEWRKDNEVLLYVVQKASIGLLVGIVDLKWTEEIFKITSKEVIEVILSRRGSFLLKCPPDIQRNEKFVQLAVSNHPEIIKDVNLELRNRPSVVKAAVMTSPSAIQFAGPTALLDQDCMDLIMKKNRESTVTPGDCYAPRIIHNKAAWFLPTRSERRYAGAPRDGAIGRRNNAVGVWMTDYSKIMQVIRGCPFAELRSIVDSLFVHNNYDHALDLNLLKLISVIIQRHPLLLEDVHTYLTKKHISWLDWSDDLREMFRDLVLGAVKIVGGVLEFTVEHLRDDDGVVKAAINNNGDAYQFASLRLRASMECVKKALERGAAIMVMKHMPASLYTFENLINVIKADNKLPMYSVKTTSASFYSGAKDYIGTSLEGKPVKDTDSMLASSLYADLPLCKWLVEKEKASLLLEWGKTLQLIRFFQDNVGRLPPPDITVCRFRTEEQHNYARERNEKIYRKAWFYGVEYVLDQNEEYREKRKVALNSSMKEKRDWPAWMFFSP